MYLARRYAGKRGNYKYQLVAACLLQLSVLFCLWRWQYSTCRTLSFRPLPPTYFDVLTDNISEVLVERRRTGCSLPHPGGYKAWRQNVVTKVTPEIPRSCSLLFRGDSEEIKRVRQANKAWNSAKFDEEFYDMTIFGGSCSRIRSEFQDNLYVTKDELDFPLAFLINIHNHPQQIVRFLKVIYRPHNLYCLHYDSKSSPKVKRVIQNLAKCLGNVLVPREVVNVVWGCYTIMEAQVNCMKALYSAQSPAYPWKYTVSLCGMELPLRTNNEMVSVLRRKQGKSAIQLFKPSKAEVRNRFNHRYIIGSDNLCYVSRIENGPVPYGVDIKKSMAYFSLSKEFIHFLLNNETSLKIYEFMKGASNSEEHYFSTVYSLAERKQVDEIDNKGKYDPLVSTVSDCMWNFQTDRKCHGRVYHSICIVESADLYQLRYSVDLGNIQGPFFHNKYSMDRDHTIIDCLEEELVRRNKLEYVHDCGHIH